MWNFCVFFTVFEFLPHPPRETPEPPGDGNFSIFWPFSVFCGLISCSGLVCQLKAPPAFTGYVGDAQCIAQTLFHAHPEGPERHLDAAQLPRNLDGQKGRKGAGVKGAGVANCRIFRSAVPSVVVWSILLVSLSGVKSYDNL